MHKDRVHDVTHFYNLEKNAFLHTFLHTNTLFPEVFLDFSSRKRSTASREAATTSRVSDEEREKNLWLPWPRISLSCRRQLSNGSKQASKSNWAQHLCWQKIKRVPYLVSSCPLHPHSTFSRKTQGFCHVMYCPEKICFMFAPASEWKEDVEWVAHHTHSDVKQYAAHSWSVIVLTSLH